MSAPAPIARVTANDMVEALRVHFGDGPNHRESYIVMTEVAATAGFGSGKQRYADLVAVGLWPSRGLSIDGVEIKVTRADWKKELADPSKAEAFGYCDHWWIAAPLGVVDQTEVPEAWGWMVLDNVRPVEPIAWRGVQGITPYTGGPLEVSP